MRRGGLPIYIYIFNILLYDQKENNNINYFEHIVSGGRIFLTFVV
jgi:hypothetical protein